MRRHAPCAAVARTRPSGAAGHTRWPRRGCKPSTTKQWLEEVLSPFVKAVSSASLPNGKKMVAIPYAHTICNGACDVIDLFVEPIIWQTRAGPGAKSSVGRRGNGGGPAGATVPYDVRGLHAARGARTRRDENSKIKLRERRRPTRAPSDWDTVQSAPHNCHGATDMLADVHANFAR